jgi:acetyl-CoA carboxylase/biotin carboxylase 1
VETRTVELQVPADPANLSSDAKVIQQAGQVWFPDSAYKTSQAIRDFSREQLPLIIFANWRGFSGGMKDMYEQVLKFGAYIVDALREYRQPVMIYIPPNGELRGGAWVVVDPTINERYMEMYADHESRGGVLEPEGTVEIKYRIKDLVKTIHRLDSKCIEIKAQISSENETLSSKKEADFTKTDLAAIKQKIQKLEKELEAREKYLTPVYHQIAIQFADLHDTPGRMLNKKVVSGVLVWRTSRKFFYWRLRRLLVQDHVIKDIIKNSKQNINFRQALDLLKNWFEEANLAKSINSLKIYKTENWDNNELITQWLESQINSNSKTLEPDSVLSNKLAQIKHDAILKQLQEIIETNPDIALESVGNLVKVASAERIKQVISTLNNQLELLISENSPQKGNDLPGHDKSDIKNTNANSV